MIIIGVDTGGTFTDFVFKEGEEWGVYKILSTPTNPAEAVLEGLGHIASGKRKQIVHGSTVATNAILERKGARTAFIANRGFEDVIEIGRQNRSRLYDLAYRKEPQIIPSDLRFGVGGRILCTGEEFEPLDRDTAEKLAGTLRDLGVESVAVCLLFSFVNPSHEKKIKEMLESTGIPVSLSHEILAEFREFERSSTTAINAYVSPKMQRYIAFIKEHLKGDDSLSIMQSNGGSISAETAMHEPVRTILSGPAGGAVGAFEIGALSGYETVISFDMGGTSTDVCLMSGGVSLTLESRISGYPLKVPMIDIHTVGAGGGSIAYLDEGGSLRVGPESAGADPGPICYGRGDRVTVTDANLYLGRIIPEHFLGGGMRLQTDRLEPHFQELAGKAGISVLELAEGILSVANTTMEKAIRVISVERGHDPRDFTLLSFGGAGGMHAAFLARLLNIPRVLIPRNPGILSAIGMIMADVIKDYSFTIMRNQTDIHHEELVRLFGALEEKGVQEMADEGISREDLILERLLDMRYQGQSYEIIVPMMDDYVERFHALHEKNYGYQNRDKMVEIVNIRLRAKGIPEKPRFPRSERLTDKIPGGAVLGRRPVVFDLKPVESVILDRDKLVSGNRLRGPAVAVEYSATVVVPPFAEIFVDEYGNMILEIQD